MNSVNSQGAIDRQEDRIPATLRTEPDIANAIGHTQPVLPMSGSAGDDDRAWALPETTSTDATAVPGRRLTSNDHHAAATRVPQPWKL